MHLRDLTQFLAELSENNNRPWFVMNKPRYDILRAEFLELVTQLIKDLSKFDPAVAAMNPKKALFRINRDLRFSHDKSLYKTHFSAAITASGLKKPSQGGGPMYYFHINQDGQLLIASGEYLPPPNRLKAIRLAVSEDVAGFNKVVKNKKLKETFGDLSEQDKLSRPPKGFAPDTPNLEFVKLKSFIVRRETSIKKKLPVDLGKDLAVAFKDALPLVTWLRQVKEAPVEE
jgi:uncharacterized protein (TIGR02453 family)